MNAMTVRPAGDRALLLEPADAAQLPLLLDHLRRTPIEGVADLLPAARTVLLTLCPGIDPAAIESRVRALDLAPGDDFDSADAAETVTVPVRYDGPDLADAAELLGITPGQLVERHTDAPWRCAFIGFAPGFGYLHAPDAGLSVPRRSQARTVVPAGSVALAGGYSAVYPRSSPGGWQIIGRTDVVLWDVARPEPALLRAGTRVRFEAVDR
ncbi:5-oxoprolinase subunit B family protein [Nocardia africana]|uniref:Sporulation inhibitor kipI n=1 Tax=Nocardia africana TaxID=134964 RepID=A0A378WW53_9NOCA|nr:allophanate hydrolase subunit 1 [Nocardia africana]MCC3313940.1 allophanate hydrolase subunit 1 [Nocardia africana]SUA44671.1 Sporulation inhibitor kipI [Nocardia africana]